MSRRKQTSPITQILDYFMDSPLAAAEGALEIAQAVMVRRRALPPDVDQVYVSPAIRAVRAQRKPRASAPMVGKSLEEILSTPEPEPAPAATATPKPVGVRRRRVAVPAAAPAPAAIAPRKRGRPFGKKVTTAAEPLPAAPWPIGNADDISMPNTAAAVRDLPDQVSPDDYEEVPS